MAVRRARHAPVSIEEFLGWPPATPEFELIDGVPEQKPLGTLEHANAAMNLRDLLRDHQATRDGKAYIELGRPYPDVHGANVRIPDVSYFGPANLPQAKRGYPERVPDLVAEVRSPGQPRRVLEARLAFLLGAGVTAGLLIDPESATVTVYEGEGSQDYHLGETVRMPALGEFSFEVDQLFA